MSELSYFTNEELANELLSRHSFCGVLVRSVKEVRGRGAHQVWEMIASGNLEDEQVYSILDEITDQLGDRLGPIEKFEN